MAKTNNDLVHNLLLIPKRDKGPNMPTYQRYKKNQIHQMDLLFLPNDRGFKYALVVVDIGSRLMDAEPVKTKTSEEIVLALIHIYARGILKQPSIRIEVDAGAEFKAQVREWAHMMKIKVKTAKPYRHRQVALVERRNQMIGKILFRRMTEQEILTGETSREWIDDLPDVVKNINQRTKKKFKFPKLKNIPVCEGDSCNVLKQGTIVRVALDAPLDVISEKRLHGKFRSTDIRWNRTPRTIIESIIQPNMPPLYLLDDGKGGTDHSVSYTKNQLQVIPKNEKLPDSSKIRAREGNLYVIEKLLERKKIKNKVMFVVKWQGFKETTMEPRSELIKDQRQMILDFEANN